MINESQMIHKLPIELVYKIFDYLDYPLLYCKYLFPHYPILNKYKLDYIEKIKQIPRYYPSGCNHFVSRIDSVKLFICDFKLPFFDEIFRNDCSIVYNYIGQMTLCSICKEQYSFNLNKILYKDNILHKDNYDIESINW
jgi:hypothetical protein